MTADVEVAESAALRQAALDRLTAERYGPSLWWKTPAPIDNECVQRRRLRLLAQEYSAGAP